MGRPKKSPTLDEHIKAAEDKVYNMRNRIEKPQRN